MDPTILLRSHDPTRLAETGTKRGLGPFSCQAEPEFQKIVPLTRNRITHIL